MESSPQPRVNPWIVTISVMLATFMEVLDTTVVNVSIPHISGNLSATYEEGTWVVTSYLVSNAIILPLSGWLARYFGRKRLLMFCVAGFAVTSGLCGAATSLTSLIIFRVLQGITGGGMQPLSQAILLETFPPQKHGQAMAAFGIGVILAPILGPTLGGWITDNYSWRWIFYLNIPVGLLSLIMIGNFVSDPEYIKRNRSAVDVWGIGFLALGLGTLQVILDTGQRKDWWSSDNIRVLTVLCIVGLAAFVIRELLISDPVVDLRVLKDRAFATGVFLISMVGFTLYASLVLLPMYLETLLGFPALQAGLALSPRGIGALIAMPVVGILVSKFDARKVLAFGFVCGGWSMYVLSRLNLNAGYWDVCWPQVAQGVAMASMFTPLAAATVSHIAKNRMGNATSIFNLMRNIGGSFGIAAMTTFVARRSQVHQNHLIEHISTADLAVQQALKQWTSYFQSQGADLVTATQRAYAATYMQVQQHASMLSFVESFWVMAVLFIALLPLLLLLRNTSRNILDTSKKPKPKLRAGEHEVIAEKAEVEQLEVTGG
jgi:MFS transporter, DHA2 family, multidrug resistance protein